MATGDDAWIVRVFDELCTEDLQLVADFFNEHFPGVFYPRCSPDIWKWKLGAGNPAGRGFLTVAYLDGKVIGTTSGTRQHIRLNGQSISGMEIGDTFTHPDFRKNGYCRDNYPGTLDKSHYLNKSVFGRLVTETLDRASLAGIQNVFGTPNLNSRPPYISKLLFTEIGLEKIKSWNMIGSKYVTSGKYMFPLHIALAFVKRVISINAFLLQRRYSFRETAFGELAEAFGTHIPIIESNTAGFGSLSFVQNLNFYEHRYHLHPTHRYRYFAITRKGELMGWIICTQIKRASGRETLVVSDWIAYKETFRRNLPNFISLVAPKFPEVEMVSVWAANNLAKRFRWNRFGFFSIKDVSIIERSLETENSSPVDEFADFRIGWSDNG